MRISIVCSNNNHPIYPHLIEWKIRRNSNHTVELFEKVNALPGGDILFLISCNELVGEPIRSKYKKVLLIHASNLPKGRGWSPHIWQILEGQSSIPVTLLEAADKVDSGRIWNSEIVTIEKHDVFDEINNKLFKVEIKLLDFAIDHFESVQPLEQADTKSSYYRKRTPEDSKIDPDKSIAEQFDLLRVADPNRFPAFFDFRGHRYHLLIIKKGKSENTE